MHVPFCSDPQLVARLVGKHDHAEHRPKDRAARRAWIVRRREYKAEHKLAVIKYGKAAYHGSIEL